MSGHQHKTIGDDVFFWFAANDTSGSGGDGATPLFDVREADAAAGAIPLLSGTPTLLTHANYPAGCHEIKVAATVGNGFAADDTFAVFCTLAIDSQNPSGFVGSCTLTPLAKAGALATVDTNVDAILVDTGTTLQAELDGIQADTEDIQTQIGAAGAGLSAVPYNAAWDAQIQSECADALAAFWTSPATLVDLVWDEDIVAAHTTADTAGDRLEAAGGAADPWGTALPGAYGAGTAGKIIGDNIDAPLSTIDSNVDAVLVDTGTTLDGKIDTIDGIVDTILVDTADIQANYATATNLATVDTVVDGIQTDLSNATDGLGALKALIDTIDTNVDAILVDTGTTLDGAVSTIDTVVDAIKVVTDKFAFTVANQVDANTQSINDATVVGDGNATPWDGV